MIIPVHLLHQRAGRLGLFLGPTGRDLPAGNQVEHRPQGEMAHLKAGQPRPIAPVIEPRRTYGSGVASPFFASTSTVRLVSIRMAAKMAAMAVLSRTSIRSAGRQGSSGGSSSPMAEA